MSKEGTPELTKSWVVVNQGPGEIQQAKDTSGVQEVTENEPHDSDTDSISVISESGCSYKTDEEDFTVTKLSEEEDEEKVNDDSGLPDIEPEIVSAQSEVGAESVATTLDENKGIEKLMYFATSAVCALILVGFSIAVQNYIQNASNVNNLEPDQNAFPHVQNLRNEKIIKEIHPNKFHIKRKNQLTSEEFEHKIAKLSNDNEFHDKITHFVGDNDPKVEGKLKSNYKPSKNKILAAKCNKDNCDVTEKTPTNHDKILENEEPNQEEIPDGSETYDKKVETLRIKEDYLREKEKFLIEKEHDLMKKELKLNKEKQQYTKNKHDKNTLNRKGKKYSEESSEEFHSSERKDKFKYKKHINTKNNKRKSMEDKKQNPQQKRFKFTDDQEKEKKRNVSGQWYLNLHEARDNMRQKKRAHFFKRNKAHWYFQWMVDRARLRVK